MQVPAKARMILTRMWEIRTQFKEHRDDNLDF